MRPALDHAPHDPAVLQHPQVLGDRGLGHPEAGGGTTDGRGAFGEPLDDSTTDWVRERLERIVNHLVNDSKGRGCNRGRGRSRAQLHDPERQETDAYRDGEWPDQRGPVREQPRSSWLQDALCAVAHERDYGSDRD